MDTQLFKMSKVEQHTNKEKFEVPRAPVSGTLTTRQECVLLKHRRGIKAGPGDTQTGALCKRVSVGTIFLDHQLRMLTAL